MTHRAKPMKGIVLAGGTGTRLHPLTLGVSKQLMPIYNKPMIYYPIATLVSSGIKEILLITTPQDASLFKTLLRDGSAWGIRFTYLTQSKPEGIAQALVLAEAFLDGAPAALILGDNLFHGKGLSDLLRQQTNPSGATIFGYAVNDPERYGVIAFDAQMNPVDLIEKPSNPPSTYAVPGIYFYNHEAPARAKAVTKSGRGEYEITEVNKSYLKDGALSVVLLDPGFTWLDTGTFAALSEASQFVEVLENRQGQLIGAPEWAAFQAGFIDADQLSALATPLMRSGYGQQLLKALNSYGAR